MYTFAEGKETIKYYLFDDGSETSTLSYQKSEISPQHIIIVSVTEKKRESIILRNISFISNLVGIIVPKLDAFLCVPFLFVNIIFGKIVQSCLSEW